MKTRTAADFMTTPVITVRPEMKLTDVIELLLRWHISGTPVVDAQGKVVGILSELDLLNFALDGNAAEATVAEAMSTTIVSFPPDASMEELANCCISKRIRRIPIITKDWRLVGIVSRRDILREMSKIYEES